MCGGGGGGDPGEYQRQQDAERKSRISQGKTQLEQLFAELEGKSKVAKIPALNLDEQQFSSQITDLLKNNVQTKSVQVPYQAPQNTAGPFGTYDPNYGGTNIGMLNYNSIMGRPNTVTQQQQNFDATGNTKLKELGIGNQGYDIAGYLDAYRQQKADPNSYNLVADGANAPIWDQQEQAYKDYANPQLDRQYGSAQGDLAFALARQGQLSSSISGENYADLNKDYQVQQQGVAEAARGFGNNARADIANEKQSLLNMLSASADPGATAMAARSSLDSLRSQPSFSPLGPLFQNATAGLAAGYGGMQNNQAKKAYDSAAYGGDPDRSTGSVRR